MAQTPQELVQAYRKLYRAGLRAVQFSKPARYVLRDQLRGAFRDRDGSFDARAVRNTVWFLKAAAAERGLEHTIVKNLLRVAGERQHAARLPWLVAKGRVKATALKHPDTIKPVAYRHYEMTVAMLNETMGLCLR